MNYSVIDSTLLQDPHNTAALYGKDNSIRVGIVREEREIDNGVTRYIVEVFKDGKQIPISCVLMTRFGGPHNFEEWRPRSWLKIKSKNLPPTTADKYTLRAGDTVVIAFLNGNGREGVILGALRHPARSKESTKSGAAEYISRFNGLETQIRSDGSYKVTFKGLPTNDSLLNIPGTPITDPIFNPLISGSYFGFSKNGSYVATDGKQFLKISKSLTSGAIILKSGKNTIELGGNPALGTTTVQTDKLVVDTLSTSIKAKKDIALDSLQFSIKGVKIAIGNDQIELFDGLIKLIDALGNLVVTSPVGSCTPLMAAPTWAAEVLPLKIKLSLIKGSVASAGSASFSGDSDIDLGSDIGS